MLTLALLLLAAVLARTAWWVASLLDRPADRCGACEARGFVRGRLWGRRTCRKCHGRGWRPRWGAAAVHSAVGRPLPVLPWTGSDSSDLASAGRGVRR